MEIIQIQLIKTKIASWVAKQLPEHLPERGYTITQFNNTSFLSDHNYIMTW